MSAGSKVVMATRRRVKRYQAQRAERSADWARSVTLWQEMLALFPPPAPAWLLLRLGSALVEAGEISRAVAVFETASVVYPSNHVFLTARAKAYEEADRWSEARDMWLEVVERIGTEASTRVWSRATRLGLRSGGEQRLRAHAELALEQDNASLGPRYALALLEEARGNLFEALAHWDAILVRAPDAVRPPDYQRIARLRSRVGDPNQALEDVARAVEIHGAQVPLVGIGARLAMAAGDWARAIAYWDGVLSGQQDALGPKLPYQSAAEGWFADSWIDLADEVLADTDLAGRLSLGLAIGIGRNLESQSPERALALVDRAIATQGVTGSSDYWRRRFRLADEHRRLRQGDAWRPGDGRDLEFAGEAEIAAAIDALGEWHPRGDGAVSPLFSARVLIGSESELAIRARGLITFDDLLEWTQREAEASKWPELVHGVDHLDGEARRWSEEFARRYSSELSVPPEVLSDAVFLQSQQLLATLQPLRRLADDLVSVGRSGPIFIQLEDRRINMFDSIDHSSAWPLLLAMELQRVGLLPVLLSVVDTEAMRVPIMELTVGVSPSFAAARAGTDPKGSAKRPIAVVPAGIRSLLRVTAKLDEPVVYASDALVHDFAYDRSVPSWIDYRPEGNFLPTRGSLRQLDVSFVTFWRDRSMERASVDLGVTALGFDDTLSLSYRLIGRYLEQAMEEARAEVSRRGIEEVHIADHLYMSSSVFAGAVREAGGRVVLWPHSSNPVHSRVRRRGSFDTVYALTRQGQAQWQREHRGAAVEHASELMLQWSDEMAPTRPEQPLSVVVLLNKESIGLTPFLPKSIQEDVVRRAFSGLRELQGELGIRILVKPKGDGAADAASLRRVLAGTVDYRFIREHPLRIQEPNAVFLTVSLATSALLEGVTRGIPGILVRDYPVDDYLDLEATGIAVCTVDEMTKLVAEISRTDRRADLTRQQVEALASQLDRRPPWYGELGTMAANQDAP